MLVKYDMVIQHDTFTAPSTTSNIHEKLNQNTNITSNSSLTAETNYSKKYAVNNKPSGIIQTEAVS